MGGSPENTAPRLIEKSLFVPGSVVVGTRTGRSNCVHDHLEKRRRPDVMALPWNRTWSPIVGTNEWKSGLDRRNCVTEILGLRLPLMTAYCAPG